MTTSGILTLSCPDRPGLVYAVSGYLVGVRTNIVESHQFEDPMHGQFFIRIRFDLLDAEPDIDTVRTGFGAVAAAHTMTFELVDAATPTRTLILVSKHGHCLNDLLFRARTGPLNIEIPAVVSNHHDLRSLVEAVGAINIHYSFLPSFVGAKPYHQAHERGVKLIGATAHYMTPELDDGPIIEQNVARVDHAHGPDELAAMGRDVEAQVLARAVKWYSERHVLLNGNRTVVVR